MQWAQLGEGVWYLVYNYICCTHMYVIYIYIYIDKITCMQCKYVHIYIYIPRPSRCAFFLPFAEKAIYCVVCSKKSLFLLKVLLQNLAKTWSAHVALWSGNVALGRAMSPFRLHPGFAKQQNMQKCAEAKKCLHQKEPLAQTAQKRHT